MFEDKTLRTVRLYYFGALIGFYFSQKKLLFILLNIILIVWKMLYKDMRNDVFLKMSMRSLTNIQWSKTGRIIIGRGICTLVPLILRPDRF